MKTKIITTAIISCYFLCCQAQYIVNEASELDDLKKLPQEKAYIDHTGPLLFSGEYLYYNLYCFNAQNNNLTNISNIGYVALMDESKNYIFEHKLKLKEGQGYGDFFITTEIPSGKYKLIGYTQWMKNSGFAQVFKDDIIIINPYLSNQSALLGEPKNTTDSNSPTNFIPSIGDTATIALRTDKVKYGPRQKVELSLRNFKGVLGHGTYTIKVKRKEEVPVPNAINSVSYATAYLNADKQIPQKLGDSIFLPEQRGELFYGTIKDSSTGKPVADIPVAISIPGKEFILKAARTDENGNFYSYLRKDYKNPLAIVQIEEQNNSYLIEKGNIPDLNLDELTFSNFRLNKSYAEYIKNRSVLNQIENQFFIVKPDSILEGNPIDPFDGVIPEVVVLDDYTRFPTFEETLVEVIKFVGYRKGGKENNYIRVAQDFESYNEQYNDYPAIILMDGVFIPNHEDIRKFDARKIEKISLTRNQFRLGNKNYQGIVSVETFEGAYLDGYAPKNSLQVPLNQPIPRKKYFVQNYANEESKFSHIPDYRRLLFWKPSITIDASSYNFEFFTSDLTGDYEIILNGFTTYGKPINATKTIKVLETYFD